MDDLIRELRDTLDMIEGEMRDLVDPPDVITEADRPLFAALTDAAFAIRRLITVARRDG